MYYNTVNGAGDTGSSIHNFYLAVTVPVLFQLMGQEVFHFLGTLTLVPGSLFWILAILLSGIYKLSASFQLLKFQDLCSPYYQVTVKIIFPTQSQTTACLTDLDFQFYSFFCWSNLLF
jgi:hypothetical protein